MHIVELKIDNSIYDNIMFLLKNLKSKGLEIKEIDNSICNDEKKDILDFSQYNIKSFKNITNPVKWQQNIRNEWGYE